ncbi:MAG: peptide chain release factor 2 [Oscillospiraceae bacterium]|mgnify:CR=1 FL=1|nr:peptide chain release factor 2 [Oscillospiraceae bacterium]
MIIIDDYKKILNDTRPQIAELAKGLGYERLSNEIEELEMHTHQPDFWQNRERANSIIAKINGLKKKKDGIDKLNSMRDDYETLIEMYEEMEDEELEKEIVEISDKFVQAVENLRLTTLLTGEYDSKNAIITLHAGEGGTESQDWCEMLFRMYTRYCTSVGYKTQTVDYLEGDEAGIKSVSFTVEGENAYGFLKSEHGVHRLVRVSPFDSKGRRHTSFASCEVMPEIEDDMEIVIRDEDIKMDVFRSSGAGGQHINKTSSAVRLTHLPTGIVVSCQTQRSQLQNRETCMKMLRSKLAEIKEREHLEKIEDIKGVQKEIAWGSQIRSYVFMPYTLVKDHRTGYQDSRVDSVMDGNIQGFLNAYLTARSKGTLSGDSDEDM